MKKSKFLEIEKKYNEERVRLQGIKKGDLIWEEVPRGGWDMDYHPAVVKTVDVDKDYVDVIDVSSDNQETRYTHFLTASELLEKGFTKETIEEERKKYEGIIKKVLESK